MLIMTKKCFVIFLDLAGAFDFTWHPSIVKSFIEKCIEKGYVDLIQDYLSNRLIRIKINNSFSQKNLKMSAPQGAGW